MELDRGHCTIGETEHPFTLEFNNKDVRITTNYKEDNVVDSMYSVIHEGGHAKYELGIRDDLQYTCLTGGVDVYKRQFQVRKGEILGIVGESGSGKSTLARCLMNVYEPKSGKVLFEGIDIFGKKAYRENKKFLPTQRQIIFQDSASSLNQRMKAKDIIAEPLRINHIRTARGSAEAEALSLIHI